MAKERNNNSFIVSNSQEPNREEVREYCRQKNSSVDPDKFYDYYSERQWKIAGEKVNSWKSVFDAWDKREVRKEPKIAASRRKIADMNDPEFANYAEYFTKNFSKLTEKWFGRNLDGQ